MRARGLILAIGLAASAPLAAIPAAGASGAAARSASVTTCGYLRASVPYTHHGTADRWRVYVNGAATCANAVEALDAVIHARATQHQGRSEASSYFVEAGWLCPFGNMGQQTCELPTRLPAHPPIRARALALDCAIPGRGCPAHVPSDDL